MSQLFASGGQSTGVSALALLNVYNLLKTEDNPHASTQQKKKKKQSADEHTTGMNLQCIMLRDRSQTHTVSPFV